VGRGGRDATEVKGKGTQKQQKNSGQKRRMARCRPLPPSLPPSPPTWSGGGVRSTRSSTAPSPWADVPWRPGPRSPRGGCSGRIARRRRRGQREGGREGRREGGKAGYLQEVAQVVGKRFAEGMKLPGAVEGAAKGERLLARGVVDLLELEGGKEGGRMGGREGRHR
jgi:hypothetical protein